MITQKGLIGTVVEVGPFKMRIIGISQPYGKYYIAVDEKKEEHLLHKETIDARYPIQHN